MKLLVTGASGFVGRALVRRLETDPAIDVRRGLRRPDDRMDSRGGAVVFGELSDGRLDAAVRGVDVVIHTAGRAHVLRDTAADPLSEFRRVNVEGTLAVARRAASAGVKRFIFLSSIKVNGEETKDGRPFTAGDLPAPADPYGISKLEAETGLWKLAADSGLEVVVIRPVLVYGPGVKGNFRVLLQWVRRGIPLPFGAVRNRRSLVALANLNDLIHRCVDHPAARGETLLVNDGDDLSTPRLLRLVGSVMRRNVTLVPVPPALLRGAATIVGRGEQMRRLCGSLQVDASRTRDVLAWTPRITADAALHETVEHFLARGAAE